MPNEDIQSRVTYSVFVPKLAPDDMRHFIRAELDRAALAHAAVVAVGGRPSVPVGPREAILRL